MRWLRRLGLLLAFLLIAALVASWDGLTGDRSTPTVTPPTTAPPGRVAADDPRVACALALSPRQQVAQLLAVGVDGRAADLEAQRVADLGIGTVLVQAMSPDRPIARIEALRERSVVPPLVAVEEEGGAVLALGEVLGPFPSPERMAGTVDAAGAREQVLARARSMATLGVDMVLAPAIDVLPADPGDPIGDDRSFGSDPVRVTRFGQAYVDAFVEAGVLPALKHFPGQGNTTGDGAIVSGPTRAGLTERDLVPYATLLDAPVAVVVGHIIIPDITVFGISSLSDGIIGDLLRDELGFDGLVLTDSLSDAGLSGQGPPPGLALQALRAGADVALFASLPDPGPVLDRLEQALADGDLDPGQVATSVVRVLDVKGIDPCAL